MSEPMTEQLPDFTEAEYTRLKAQKDEILEREWHREHDAVYQRGLAAGRAEALEQAAGVCDVRADTPRHPVIRGEEAAACAKAIRALAHQPPPTGGHGAAET